jgi:hypothetical protein
VNPEFSWGPYSRRRDNSNLGSIAVDAIDGVADLPGPGPQRGPDLACPSSGGAASWIDEPLSREPPVLRMQADRRTPR